MNSKDLLGVGVVVAAFVLLAMSTLVLLEALDVLWTNRRFIYLVTGPFAAPFGGNRDVPVLVFVGALSGWFVLFWIDATKRVQGALVFVAAVISVGPYLQRTQRILDAIGRTTWAFVVGVVVGVVTGLLSVRLIGGDRPGGVLERLQWLRYPGAAAAFRHASTAIVGVVTVDYVLYSGNGPSTPLVVLSSVVFVFSLSTFLRYGYDRQVVTLSPRPTASETNYQAYALGGLYGLADDKYGAFSIGRGDVGGLLAARTAASVDGLPSFDSAVGFAVSSMRIRTSDSPAWLRKTVQFLLPRPVTIESDALTTPRIGVPDNHDRETSATNYLRYLIRSLKRHTVEIVPATVRDALPKRGQETINRLDRADTVLLVAPTPAEDRDDEEWARSFSAVCERYTNSPGTDVVLATTEARSVADAENTAMRDQVFKRQTASRLGIATSDLSTNDIYPLDRFSGENDGDREFDQLLDRLCD